MKRGRFIVIDGSEGAGKSTQINYIRDWLSEHHIDFWLTREPGGTAVGEQVRNILLNPANTIDADAELLLMMAARRQHLSAEILPRLSRGQWVICDRFNDSTYAYQGYGRGINITRIAELERWAMPDVEPDLRLIMSVSPEIAMQRLDQRNTHKDRFEQEQAEFFAAVAHGYHVRAQRENAVSIDADGDSDSVFEQIRPHLMAQL
ncbi:dTMP kinase [Cardiobacteriaceae bacterium TAE3-ERU3]|nr:dTMP kinase [Cardiobacteriaceae bacterium TAE3-ERU3]